VLGHSFSPFAVFRESSQKVRLEKNSKREKAEQKADSFPLTADSGSLAAGS
jgi:hypothetical protein